MRRRSWILALATAFACSVGTAAAAGQTSSASKVRAKTAVTKSSVKSAAAPRGGTVGKVPARAARAQTNAVRTPAKAARSVAASKSRGKLARGASARGARVSAVRVHATPRDVVPARISVGQAIGLHAIDDPLDLHSSVAMVVDEQTGQTLFSKNVRAVLPIASITKLMTALVVLDSHAPLGEVLTISADDIDTEKNSGSRLAPGSRLSRNEMLQLALMSSENRAAHALGRHHAGGMSAFVAAMNAKAQALGMTDTRYVEPTGLSSSNVSTARDLIKLVREATLHYPLVRQYSTASDLTVDTGYRQITYRNTNRLISSPTWEIGLQKTGYISEAGSCLVMQASIEGRPVVMVLLDAAGSSSRFGDANRLRRWIEHDSGRNNPMRTVAMSRSAGS